MHGCMASLAWAPIWRPSSWVRTRTLDSLWSPTGDVGSKQTSAVHNGVSISRLDPMYVAAGPFVVVWSSILSTATLNYPLVRGVRVERPSAVVGLPSDAIVSVIAWVWGRPSRECTYLLMGSASTPACSLGTCPDHDLSDSAVGRHWMIPPSSLSTLLNELAMASGLRYGFISGWQLFQSVSNIPKCRTGSVVSMCMYASRHFRVS